MRPMVLAYLRRIVLIAHLQLFTQPFGPLRSGDSSVDLGF